MKRILTPYIVLCIFSCLLGVLIYSPTSIELSPSSNNGDELEYEAGLKTENWIQTMQKVKDFYEPPAQSNEQAQDNNVDKAIVYSLKDASLVGIVTGKEPKVYILLPQSVEPQVLSVGQGWLDGWTIKDINKDQVIWINQNTQNTSVQYLFGEQLADSEG